MNEAYPSGYAGAAIRSEIRHAVALCAADWLGLAAAPTFGMMALLTVVVGSTQPDIICSGPEHTSLLSGMIPMYLLMSTFHLPRWLKLISSREQNEARGLRHRRRYVAAAHEIMVRATAFDRQQAVEEMQERIGTGETHGHEQGERHAA